MQFHRPLLEGVLLQRYKRFFADIDYNGEKLLAHVPNSGSMKGCKEPNSLCRFSFVDDPKRKLKYTLEMVKSGSTWVGVNTSWPNKIVHEAFENKIISEWNIFNRIQREVYVNEKSRIDFAMWSSEEESGESNRLEFKKINLKTSKIKFHFVEVKNVSLAEEGTALFPDAVTERGQKHLTELMKLQDWGHTTEILFTIQRSDVSKFSSADAIDPQYGELLRKAKHYGVKISPYLCHISNDEVCLTNKKLGY